MKFIKSLPMAVSLLVAIILCGCSSKDASLDNMLKNYVSDSSDIVFVADMQSWLENTHTTVNKDGTLNLSPELSKLIGDTEQIENFKGLDYTYIVIADIKDNGQLLIMPLSDEDEFGKSLKDCGFESSKVDGYTSYTNDDQCYIVKDKCAFSSFRTHNPSKVASIAEAAKEAAKDAPIADWKAKYLSEKGLVKGLFSAEQALDYINKANQQMYANINVAQFKGGIIGTNFAVDGLTAKLSVDMYDKDGNDMQMPYTGKFDDSLLKYANANDIFVFGAGSTVTPEMRQQMRQNYTNAGLTSGDVEVIDNIIAYLGGQYMISFGADSSNLMSLITNGKNIDLTFVTSLAEGKDAELRELVKEYGSMLNVSNANSDYSQFSIDITDLSKTLGFYDNYLKGMTCYASIKDGLLVISTQPISDNGKVNNAKLFDNATGAMFLTLNKSIFQMVNLPFGIDVTGRCEGSHAYIDVTLTDAQGDLFDNLVKVANL